MRARIEFKDGRREAFDDVVEGHWGYRNPLGGKRVAVEGEDTGYTYAAEDIAELEVFEGEKVSGPRCPLCGHVSRYSNDWGVPVCSNDACRVENFRKS